MSESCDLLFVKGVGGHAVDTRETRQLIRVVAGLIHDQNARDTRIRELLESLRQMPDPEGRSEVEGDDCDVLDRTRIGLAQIKTYAVGVERMQQSRCVDAAVPQPSEVRAPASPIFGGPHRKRAEPLALIIGSAVRREEMAESNEGPPVPPVLLLVWRRPDSTRALIDSIRASRPQQVFVSGDGPRSAEDEVDVRKVREVVEMAIDWDCEVRTRFSPVNLGCERGVTSGVDWFFTFVDHGVILEDDLRPHSDFLRLSGELLDRYRDEARVWAICGHNESALSGDQDGSVAGFPEGGNYTFVPYFHPWGWATWSDRWAQYDRDLTLWRAQRTSVEFEDWCHDFEEEYTWRWIFGDLAVRSSDDIWGWRWSQTIMFSGGVVAVPRVNLVQNDGFGDGSTHTAVSNEQQRRPAFELGPVLHPDRVMVDYAYRRQYFLTVYAWFIAKGQSGRAIRMQRRLPRRFRRILRRFASALSGSERAG